MNITTATAFTDAAAAAVTDYLELAARGVDADKARAELPAWADRGTWNRAAVIAGWANTWNWAPLHACADCAPAMLANIAAEAVGPHADTLEAAELAEAFEDFTAALEEWEPITVAAAAAVYGADWMPEGAPLHRTGHVCNRCDAPLFEEGVNAGRVGDPDWTAERLAKVAHVNELVASGALEVRTRSDTWSSDDDLSPAMREALHEGTLQFIALDVTATLTGAEAGLSGVLYDWCSGSATPSITATDNGKDGDPWTVGPTELDGWTALEVCDLVAELGTVPVQLRMAELEEVTAGV